MTACSPVFNFSLRVTELLVIPGIKNLKSVHFACVLGSSLMDRALSCYSAIWTLAPRRVNFYFPVLVLYWPITVCSKSTIIARGTYFLALVSLKNVAKESSLLGWSVKVPFGWIPCSRQKSSQHALPIWTPAWPMWTEMHSRWKEETREIVRTVNILRLHKLILLETPSQPIITKFSTRLGLMENILTLFYK